MIELIPAIDLINGQVVRLRQGDYAQKTIYSDSPAETARKIEQMGFRRLHVVDLDGAKAKHIVNVDALRAITSETSLEVDFGGGIRTDEDIETAFKAGARMVTIGSVAVQHPERMEGWIGKYGAGRIILGADVRDGKVSINGWLQDSSTDLIPLLEKYVGMGIKKVLITDISRDGMMTGPSTELYKKVLQRFPTLHLIASGGVSSDEDIEALRKAGIPAVVFGKALYEGKIKTRPTPTLCKRIIPCLDVKDGMTVKGTNFVNLKTVGDAVELGHWYSEQGADELVYLDITASHEGRKTFTNLVERLSREINIPFTVGGGISELSDVERLLEAGADKVSLNSAALRNPQLINEVSAKYGNQVLVIAIDAKQEADGRWMCYMNGGRLRTERELTEWAMEAAERGAGEILFTSMDHDGVKQGFANEALRKLSETLTIPIIASGGAGTMEHFRDAFINGKADAALAASVFHYGEIKISELKKYLNSEGITVRL